MKMEVLPVQSQFQGQFSVMGSSKIKGIYLYIYITYSFVLCSFLPSFIHCLFRCKSDFPILHRLFDLIPFFSISIFYWDALYVEKIMTRDSNKKLTIKTGLCMKKKGFRRPRKSLVCSKPWLFSLVNSFSEFSPFNAFTFEHLLYFILFCVCVCVCVSVWGRSEKLKILSANKEFHEKMRKNM